MADKGTLREVYLSKRLMLSVAEYERRSAKLIAKAIDLIIERNAKNVHIFLPIVAKNEVDTWQVINYFNDNPEVRFIIPKTQPQGELNHYLLNEQCRIELNNWGIPEPISGEIADINSIDLVFVPLVVADKYGNRIGYGKGYYDRFLARTDVFKVGLSMQTLLDEIPFIEETDAALDNVLFN